MVHVEYEINCFFDNELDEQETKNLFIHLSECKECRKIYNNQLVLSIKMKEHYSNNSLNSVNTRRNVVYKLSAAAIILLAAFFVFRLSYSPAPMNSNTITNTKNPSVITKLADNVVINEQRIIEQKGERKLTNHTSAKYKSLRAVSFSKKVNDIKPINILESDYLQNKLVGN